MASPTSWVVSSALPVARTASSTRWPSWASASSVTGRPWHALRTPLMTLVRLKGSVTPDRLITMSEHVSTVVKRREQSGHWRRLRIDVPSSVVRLSTTRLSGCLQKGQCMELPIPFQCTTQWPRGAQEPLEAAPSIGDDPGLEDPGHHNFWAAVNMQPLHVVIAPPFGPNARVVPGSDVPYASSRRGCTGTRRTPHGGGAGSRAARGRMADWAHACAAPARARVPPHRPGTPRGRRRSRRVTMRSYTPGEVIASGRPRFFTRTCVWRNLSKASTVVQQGDHREGPT